MEGMACKVQRTMLFLLPRIDTGQLDLTLRTSTRAPHYLIFPDWRRVYHLHSRGGLHESFRDTK